jgi:hypothetical protein
MIEGSKDFSKLDEAFPSISLSLFMSVYAPLLKSDSPLDFNLRWVNEVSKSANSFVYLTNEAGDIVDVVPPLKAPVDISAFINEDTLTYISDEDRRDARYGAIALKQVLDNIPLHNESKEVKSVHKWRAFLERNGIEVEYNDNMPTTSIVNGDDDIEWEAV